MAPGRRVKSNRPLVVREGVAPALVSHAEFAAVQALKATRPGIRRQQGPPRAWSSPSLLTGLLRCRCGHSCCSSYSVSGGVRYRYYWCSGYQEKGGGFCRSGRIRQDLLDRTVADRFQMLYRRPDLKDLLRRRLSLQVDRELEAARAAVDAARLESERLTAADRRLRTMLLEGKLTPPEYRELRRDLGQDLAQARQVQRRAEQHETSIQSARSSRGPLMQLMERLNAWDALDPIEQKILVRHFTARLVAHRDRQSGNTSVEITWCWPEDRDDESG